MEQPIPYPDPKRMRELARQLVCVRSQSGREMFVPLNDLPIRVRSESGREMFVTFNDLPLHLQRRVVQKLVESTIVKRS